MSAHPLTVFIACVLISCVAIPALSDDITKDQLAGLSKEVSPPQQRLQDTQESDHWLDGWPDSLIALYEERIEHLNLEIHNESKRRTTILGQIDSAMAKITALDDIHNNTSISTTGTEENLQQVSNELLTVAKNIKASQLLLKEINDALKTYPKPTVWQAALGNPKLAQQQKQLATQRYLIHTTTQHLKKLEVQKQQLDRKRDSIVDYEKGRSESINALRQQTDASQEHSRDLELQLVKLAAQIVKKQDRLALLSQRAAVLKSDPDSLTFENFKKQLSDPIDGELLKAFGDRKAKGLLKWQGLVIAAPIGQPITAVSDGLVVFADKILGLGNVVIVEHSDGYMSLYGMAELLMVETDQILLAGDPIGSVGHSIGLDTTALYFEIRHNAATLDPQDWLAMHRISQKSEP